MLSKDGSMIYVGGNPDLYPLEYYDTHSGSYEGAITEFLDGFAAEYGYELQYLKPGETDNRRQYARNRQVDIISGCDEGDEFPNIAGEPLTLFDTGSDGEEYSIMFTDIAPAKLRSDLSEYASGYTQEEWTGLIVEASETAAASEETDYLPFVTAGLAALAAAVLTVVFLRIHGRKKQISLNRYRDPVTGLSTEKNLEEAFSHLKMDQSRDEYHLICFHLNLDRIGYLYGQARARVLYIHCIEAVKSAAGMADLIVSTEASDILVLKRLQSRERAREWADSVLKKIYEFSAVGMKLDHCDVTAGVFSLESGYQEFDQALFHVHQCAVKASITGEECRLCSTEKCFGCQERWQLLYDFEKGLERKEFQLYLQFFVDANSFKVVGGEALSRWKHPRLGLLTPDRYVPLLEDDGRIGELDFYGLEKTCEFLEKLDKHGIKDFFISCNFARKTFSSPNFVRRFIEIIEKYTFTRKLLILEVTESQWMDRDEAGQMLDNILEIHKHGSRVIFDDFGMGFSSFHDLQDYPMDGLKLDKELVDNMWTEQGKIIMSALVETGHRMGLTILAEGVEKDSQIETLRSINCDVLQGFRFYVPLPTYEAEKRILEELEKREN